ncbi:hypothetical protein LG293_16730 (plasmid) [Citricoccus nitrophenolicus]
MLALFTTITIIFGAVALIFGAVKGIRDFRNGRLVFTEFRMVVGGALMAGATVTANIFTPIVLAIPEVDQALVAVGELPVTAIDLCWWVLAIACAALSVFITPGPRSMMEEYAIERHGVAGMLLNQHNSGQGYAGR